MRGTNDLVLNEATMIEAVQLWLDSQVVNKRDKVTCIECKSSNYAKTFTVTVQEIEAEP